MDTYTLSHLSDPDLLRELSALVEKNRADTATPFFLIRALFGPALAAAALPLQPAASSGLSSHCLEFERRGPRHWSESARVDALEPLSSRNSDTTGRLAEMENRRSKALKHP